MRAPRRNALQMLFVEIARPPDDVGRRSGEGDDMLAGAAAGFQHVAGPSGEEFLQHRPDRLVVAMERGRVEAAIRLDPPSVLAEFNDIFRHRRSTFTSDRRSKFPSALAEAAKYACRRRCSAASERSGGTSPVHRRAVSPDAATA